MRPINQFLLDHHLRVSENPCISPDFCLDWEALKTKLPEGDAIKEWAHSRFETAHGAWTLFEDETT